MKQEPGVLNHSENVPVKKIQVVFSSKNSSFFTPQLKLNARKKKIGFPAKCQDCSLKLGTLVFSACPGQPALLHLPGNGQYLPT